MEGFLDLSRVLYPTFLEIPVCLLKLLELDNVVAHYIMVGEFHCKYPNHD